MPPANPDTHQWNTEGSTSILRVNHVMVVLLNQPINQSICVNVVDLVTVQTPALSSHTLNCG